MGASALRSGLGPALRRERRLGGLLYTLDTGTGSASPVGVVLDEFGQPIDASAPAFDSAGTLYVSTDSQLVELDPATGAWTLRGPTPAASGLEVVGPCGDAPAPPVPAVSPWGLLLLVLALVAGAGSDAGFRKPRRRA